MSEHNFFEGTDFINGKELMERREQEEHKQELRTIVERWSNS